MDIKDILKLVDQDYIVRIRRQLHKRPETGFDLPETIQLVRNELDSLGISYTERYGKSSIVATINPQLTGFTAGIRADLDALPIEEANDIPYRSEISGKMHACGHDGHTAMLLGIAKALSKAGGAFVCRIMLIFQPSEEGPASGAKVLTENGLMDEIDVMLGGHVDNSLETGKIGIRAGLAMAASTNITIEFNGKSSHAAMPHTAIDALAAAVKCYMGIQLMKSMEIDPFEPFVASVGCLSAGKTHNVISDHAVMKITVRTFSEKTDSYIFHRIEEIAGNAAGETGAGCRVIKNEGYPALFNDISLSAAITDAACKIVGKENVIMLERPRMSSEDFAFYAKIKPGCHIRIGSRNEDKGFVNMPHTDSWDFDENALSIGAGVFLQYVYDITHGSQG